MHVGIEQRGVALNEGVQGWITYQEEILHREGGEARTQVSQSVAAPSLAVLKASLDGTLGNLV